MQRCYTFAVIKAEKINAPFWRAERSKGFRSLFPCFLQCLDLKRKLRKHSAFKIMLRPTARLMALPLQDVFRFESWQIACTWPWDSSDWLTLATALWLLSQSGSRADCWSRSACVAARWWPGTTRHPRNILQVPVGYRPAGRHVSCQQLGLTSSCSPGHLVRTHHRTCIHEVPWAGGGG